MSIATSSPKKQRWSRLLALLALSAFAVVALTRCNLTSDRVTGIDRAAQAQNSPGACISDCAHQANAAMKDEQDLHKANVQACAGDPTCLANEEARHEAAVAAIQEARDACKAGCHQQGGGSGR